jgi:hypothetical protein
MNKVEIGLAILLIVSILFSRNENRSYFGMFAGVLFVLFLQTIWLLPVLDARAVQLLNGNPPLPSNLHITYIFTDAVKVILLMALGIASLKSNVAALTD